MNRDGIAEPRYPDAPEAPGRGEVHVWRIALGTEGGRATAQRALREILGAYLDEEPAVIELTVGEAGKPGLTASPSPLSFNLSHSGGLALVAVVAADSEVGVDIERLRPRRDLVRLAARWLPRDDAEAVAKAPEGEREEAFYAAWTRYEARAKCTGAGLAGPPPGPEVRAWPIAIDAGYAAAVALVGAARPRIVLRDASGRR